jgi:hypothetical protein
MYKLRELFLDAMQAAGYDLITSLQWWHKSYLPEIKALPPGKYTYTIGKHEISFKKTGEDSPIKNATIPD